MPLAHVIILPESIWQIHLAKSMLDIIFDKWGQGETAAALMVCITSIVVPCLMFVGEAILIFDNFFAKGYEWSGCLTKSGRNAIVDAMCTICCYEVMGSFLAVLGLCFFTG